MSLATATHDDPLHGKVGPEKIWTTANTAEAMPGVQTPLGWTFWSDPLELAMRGSFCDIGVLRKSEVVAHDEMDERFSGIFYGRFVANVEKLRTVGDRMPGTSGDAVEEQIFGTAASGLSSKNSNRRLPAVARKMPLLVKGLPKKVGALRAAYDPWWRAQTSPEVIADTAGAATRFAEGRRRFHDMMRPHCSATMLAQAMYEQVEQLAEGAGLAGLETSLITGYGEMEEAKVAADLWDVSRGELELREFISRHGYHGPNEGALQSRSWREDDAPLKALIETYKTMGDEESPHKVMDERRGARLEAEEQLLAATPPLQRGRAKLILKMAARHIPLREVGKAGFLQAIDVSRAAARSHGAHLVEAGVLDNPEDVFYLTVEELESGAPSEARALVAARREKRDEYLGLRLPDLWQGEPEKTAARGGGERPDELDGRAVSPGVVEGIARVVDDPDAGIDIEPGEVLVCETTDPSWASYFLVASALVIDIGGAMSHGAIVAREMGIPCVINTRVGTTAISTGDRVRVDGGAGEVQVLERVAGSPA